MLLLRDPRSHPLQQRQPGKHRGNSLSRSVLAVLPVAAGTAVPLAHTGVQGVAEIPSKGRQRCVGGESASPRALAWQPEQTSEDHPHPGSGMHRLLLQRPALALIQPCLQSRGCKPEVFSAIICHP